MIKGDGWLVCVRKQAGAEFPSLFYASLDDEWVSQVIEARSGFWKCTADLGGFERGHDTALGMKLLLIRVSCSVAMITRPQPLGEMKKIVFLQVKH